MINRRAVLSAAALSPLLSMRLGASAQDQESPFFSMLSALPSLATVDDDSSARAFGWCDLTAVMASINEDGWPEDINEFQSLIEVTQSIVLETSLVTNAAQDLDALLGFDLSEIEQGVFAFQPPGMARVWTGRFDPDRIASALAEEDYVKTSHGASLVFASPTGDEITLTSDLARIGVGEFNYLIVNEHRIITTATRSMLGLLLDQDSADDSLLTSFGDSPLPELVSDSTTALVLHGSSLTAESLRLEPANSTAVLPAANWFSGAVSLDVNSVASQFLIEFNEADSDDAAEIIADRIESGTSLLVNRPYAELLGETEVSVLPGTGIVQIKGESEDFARNWARLIYAQDLAFLATG